MKYETHKLKKDLIVVKNVKLPLKLTYTSSDTKPVLDSQVSPASNQWYGALHSIIILKKCHVILSAISD